MEADTWEAARAVLRRRIAKSREYQSLLRSKQFPSIVSLAAHEGMTRVRMWQLLRLLKLAPGILLDLENPTVHRPVPGERFLQTLIDLPSGEQVERFCSFVAKQGHGVRPARCKGFQHLFDRARRYHAEMTNGGLRAMADVAAAEGITTTRVRQVLMLLQLPVDILRRLDVPPDELPTGFTEKDLRWISSARDEQEQRRRWMEALGRSGSVS